VILAFENGTHYFDGIHHHTPFDFGTLSDPETHPEFSQNLEYVLKL
jgi:hypothetical protein